jgi:hypothetical protein
MDLNICAVSTLRSIFGTKRANGGLKMKFLIDANIFLEVMLNQQHAQEAKSFLQKSDIHEYFISDFSLHSIALILLQRRAFNLLEHFIANTIRSGSIRVLGVPPDDFTTSIQAIEVLRPCMHCLRAIFCQRRLAFPCASVCTQMNRCDCTPTNNLPRAICHTGSYGCIPATFCKI